MMSLLITQLLEASRHASSLAADQHLLAAKHAERTAKSAATRKANHARRGPCKYLGKGLKAALMQRIPFGKEAALPLPEIRKLLTDIEYAQNGLTSALCNLVADGYLDRTGANRRFAYYRIHP